MWLRSGKMMFWSNALSAADLNMCSGNACPSRSRRKASPAPALAPAVLNSNKAAQQPLFPCSQAQEQQLRHDCTGGHPTAHPQSQGHAPATLNNCYSTGKIQPGENLRGFWKCSPQSSRENKQHRDSSFGKKLLGMHSFSISRFTWSSIFITSKK